MSLCKKILAPILLFVLGAAQLAAAQTREIYTNPKFRDLAKNHKTLAVLPFAVELQLRPNGVTKNGGSEGVARLEAREKASACKAPCNRISLSARPKTT